MRLQDQQRSEPPTKLIDGRGIRVKIAFDTSARIASISISGVKFSAEKEQD